MKVVVLGGGVVGVATAFYLARDGHKVSIIDRRPEVASECSYGNPGILSPSRTYSMASPRIWRLLPHLLVSTDSPIQINFHPDPKLLLWLFRFLAYCTPRQYLNITRKKLSLCLYSLQKFNDVLRETGIDFTTRREGLLSLFRKTSSFNQEIKDADVLLQQGLDLKFLDREALLQLEPALAYGTTPLAGGVYSPRDETGNPAEFTRNLATWLQKNVGVELRTEETVKRLVVSQERVREVVTNKERVSADAFVLACGAASPLISKTIGLRLPIYPVKGYTITAPIASENFAPAISCLEVEKNFVVARIGSKLRVSFKMEFTGYDERIDQKAFVRPIELAEERFPGAADFANGEYWTGLRSMTPHGLPLLGPTRFDNLFLNTGHGHLGWSTACGTGKIVSDLMAGREPELDVTDLFHGARASFPGYQTSN